MKAILCLALIICTAQSSAPAGDLVFPGLLKKEALEAGNPLATCAAMLELEPQYLKSKIFAGIYPEVRARAWGLVRQPTVFVNRKEGRLLGSQSFDAYIFLDTNQNRRCRAGLDVQNARP
jgi:hypothetical protein